MVSRRRFLKVLAGSSGLAASAGCVGTRWWEDEQDGEEQTGSESSDAGGDETDRTDPAADENGPSPEREDDESSTEDEGESTQEHHTDDEERQHEPDEEDLEVDEDEYEDHGTSETEQRSPDDIEIDAEADLEDSGAARVAGTVTNTSETPIDVVDLEITFSDADGGYLTADLVSVHDLGAGESDSFESTITPDQARGQPGHVDIEPTVYDQAN